MKIRLEQAEVLQIKESILSELDMSRELEDEEVYDAILQKCGRIAKEKMLSLSEQESIQQYLFHALRKLDVLQELIEDTEVTEIMVNGPNQIFLEKKGQISLWEN
ncbi:MAG: CpaF family protein, partial [Lachnospiraceae bacterium]|nr:CpaF family protein [Lachnospiraceae bacterium]